jgi:hypothetical protein
MRESTMYRSILRETLKHNAPIWKKEYWQDSSGNWVSIGVCEEVRIAIEVHCIILDVLDANKIV